MELRRCQDELRKLFGIEMENSWWETLRRFTHQEIQLSIVLDTIIRQNFHAIPFVPLKSAPEEELSLDGKKYPRHKIYQIEESRDISKSFHSQPTDNSTEEKTGESHRSSRKRMLKLAITDGFEMSIALDAFSSTQIDKIPSIGAKIAVQLPIRRSLGVILLSDTNSIYLGGSIACSQEAGPQAESESVGRLSGDVQADTRGGLNLLPVDPPIDRTVEKFAPVQNFNSQAAKPAVSDMATPVNPIQRLAQEDLPVSSSPRSQTLFEALQMNSPGRMLVRARICSLIPPLKVTPSEIILRCELRDGNLSALCYFASGFLEQMIGLRASELVDTPPAAMGHVRNTVSKYALALSQHDTVFCVEFDGQRGLVIKSCVNKRK